MQEPASLVPLTNIFLLWTESSDHSWLNRPLSTWSEVEDAIHSMAAVAPEYGYDKTRFRVEWADGESHGVRLDIALAASMPVCPDSEDGHDCVLMNPPFSKGQDVAHILHALKFLKPGGRLVALCAAGPRQQAELRPLATTWEELPGDTFASQGTNVRAALMMVQR